ncbi:MAG: TetR/AcrR family transcriptional regulator [Gammaproteobacteria bacterium]|nr:TetR/AcrR family transcriptional regulator [Gammaproteobacteria bacterium]
MDIEPLSKIGQSNEQNTKRLILEKAVTLFSQKGFKGVSMRELSTAAGVTPAALYYYFPNKKVLHEATVVYAYGDREKPAVENLQEPELEPIEILEGFVFRLCERFGNDPDFRRLVQWTLLDAETDEVINNIIIKVVYDTHFDSLKFFLKKFNSQFDPYRLTIFIFGMVMQNYFTLSVRSPRDDFKAPKETPKEITKEVMTLLTTAIIKS